MKVKVTVTLDVDADAWAREFYLDREDVREDVQIYFADTCHEQLASLGLNLKVRS